MKIRKQNSVKNIINLNKIRAKCAKMTEENDLIRNDMNGDSTFDINQTIKIENCQKSSTDANNLTNNKPKALQGGRLQFFKGTISLLL